MSEISPLPGFEARVPFELRPAKISDRFVAYFLDLVPFLIGFGASLYVIAVRLQAAEPTPQFVLRLGELWLGLLILYQFIGNLLGATIGKRLMGIQVARRDGSPLGAARSLIRAAGYLLSAPLCNFGFLVALVHPESRTLHDILSGALVTESRAKPRSEAAVLFLAALCVISALFLGNIYLTLSRPLPSDILAVRKAQEGINILAQIEEAYKAKNGAFTNSLAELANASGDVAEFKKAMLEIFDPNSFRIEAGASRYRISAAAKDRKKTRVSITGP